MGIHFTTAVIPAARSGTEYDTAAVFLGPEMEADVPRLPLPATLHIVGNTVTPFAAHGRPVGDPMPVSDRWVQASRAVGGYGAQAKVVVLLEPLPEEVSTADVPVQMGIGEDGLPGWLPGVLEGRYKMAMRDVTVSEGSVLLLDTALGVPAQLPEWATVLHDPR
ncbi:hypothetical protein [Streptomyces sp. C36]|uniref:hypothetical protein n=1 Tax=Streptomyces sp. C36 TaxID=3237122 RepID=UPI0034C6502D